MNERHVEDDLAVLDAMVTDWLAGPTVSEVTGDLVKLYMSFVDDLRSKGLRENIQNAVRGLTAVNGCDTLPTRAATAKLERNSSIEEPTKKAIAAALDFIASHRDVPVLPYDLSLADLDEAAYRMCDLYGRVRGAAPLSSIEMSTPHFPEYFFLVNGKKYSNIFLYAYLHYAYLSQFIDFEKVDNIIEIGPGAGRQVEVIRKLHPHIKFYLIDLAPTLYVCNRYMDAMFPGSVVPYEQIRSADSITLDQPGAIATIGNWQLDKVRPSGVTLSFNTAVYCLMVPQTVRRYLEPIAKMSQAVYLMEPATDLCREIYNMPAAPTFDTYKDILSSRFDLVDRSPALRPLNYRRDFGGFEMMTWIAKDAKGHAFVRSSPA
jgi:putative sugar O-methyltransferase